MIDAEGELNERAGLAEEDVRVDAGERGLPELGDGSLLPVAPLDLRAQARELGEPLRAAAGDEVERLLRIRSGIVYGNTIPSVIQLTLPPNNGRILPPDTTDVAATKGA
ncbi:MAG TPA: hypothetical protein VJZ76_14895 [Thermoanaerobaculia bacterium]|nr:hypothetical protein [Thermoanaerobaculia bacterium]